MVAICFVPPLSKVALENLLRYIVPSPKGQCHHKFISNRDTPVDRRIINSVPHFQDLERVLFDNKQKKQKKESRLTGSYVVSTLLFDWESKNLREKE